MGRTLKAEKWKWVLIRMGSDVLELGSKLSPGFCIDIGNFLDEARRERKIPEKYPDEFTVRNKVEQSYLIATIHSLALEFGLPTPSYIFDRKYVLPEPYFSFQAKGKHRIYLMATSPATFMRLNMFVAENALSRA